MAGERVKLVVSERTRLGSAETRRLRKQGLVPGVLYGRANPVAIAVGERELRAALTTSAGANAVLDVSVEGGSAHSAILKDFQRDKVRGQITHIDLLEVRLDQPIHATVSLTLVGDSIGVREGGVLTQVTTEINVEALPLEVPEHLEADVSELGVGESLRLSHVQLPAGVTFLDDPEEIVIASVALVREEIPEELEEAAEEAAEGGEPAAVAEAPEDAAGEQETVEG